MRVFVLCLLFSACVGLPEVSRLGRGVGDMHFNKFTCSEQNPCEPNVGRHMSWYNINARSGVNSIRGHSATTVRDGVLVIGGLVERVCSSAAYLLNPELNTWDKVDFTGSFPPRYGHVAGASLDGTTVYVFGGSCRGQHFNDLLSFNTVTKEVTRLETSGKMPPLTEGAKGIVLHKLLVVFGGCSYSAKQSCPTSLFTLNLDTLVWVEHQTTGQIPEGRVDHSMFAFNETIYVYGGRIADTHFNDLHAIRPGVWHWRQIRTNGLEGPSVGSMTISVVSPPNNLKHPRPDARPRAYLIGGCKHPSSAEAAAPVPASAEPEPEPAFPINPDRIVLPINSASRALAPPPLPVSLKNDLAKSEPGDDNEEVMGPDLSSVSMLQFDQVEQQQARPGPNTRVRLPRENSMCNADVFVLNLDTFEWTNDHTTGAIPSPREAHAAAVVGRRVFTIGGCQDQVCVSDIYMIDTQLHCVEECHNHGTCVEGLCECHHHFDGFACEIDLRCPGNCSDHGNCVDAECQCSEGFVGRDCALDTRCPNNCTDHGRCEDGKCVCTEPYHGVSCESATNCPSDCNGHGFCNFGFCYCEPGFEGKDCSVPRAVDAHGKAIRNSTNALQNDSATGAGFAFAGSNQICGGDAISERENTTLSECRGMCSETARCVNLVWVSTQKICRVFDENGCDEMWSSPGSYVYKKIGASKSEEEVEKPKRARVAPVRKAVVPQAAEQPTPAGVGAFDDQKASSTAVFLYVGIGILVGTILGVMGKSLTRRSRDVEYF